MTNLVGNFDAIILGTGLTESITAAALSKAGFKIAHLDTNPYYGGDEASLSLDELIRWADELSSDEEPGSSYIASQRSKFTSISRSTSTLPHMRQYSISLSPSIIPSVGPLISTLVSSGVSKYGGFRLLERVGIYDPSGVVQNVPDSKEGIFKNKSISLIDKRRLMRFLTFAAGEFEGSTELEGEDATPFVDFLSNTFSLNDDMANAITYALTYCSSASEPTLPTLCRLRRYLRSAGRYGASSFLVGHYGGSGEIAQGFCRISAVSGGVYILGRSISSLTQPTTSPAAEANSPLPPRYTLELDNFPDRLTCNLIISSLSLVPPNLLRSAKYIPTSTPSVHSSMARCIAVIDQPILFTGSFPPKMPSVTAPGSHRDAEHPDTQILVFPPSSVPGASPTTAATVLITGEGTMSAPKGKWIVYISLPTSTFVPSTTTSESLLKPYLDATLSFMPTPSVAPFTLFYIQHPPPPPSFSSPSNPTILTYTPHSVLLPDTADECATTAESLFLEAITILKSSESEEIDISSIWPPGDCEDDTEDW